MKEIGISGSYLNYCAIPKAPKGQPETKRNISQTNSTRLSRLPRQSLRKFAFMAAKEYASTRLVKAE